MKKSLTTSIVLAAVASLAVLSANANSVTLSVGLGSTYHSLGAIYSNSDSGGQDDAAAADVSDILALALNHTGTPTFGSPSGGATDERSGNTFSPLPTPTTTGYDEPSGVSFTLPTTESYTYLVAKFGKNEFVWDIADIVPGTTIVIPSGANAFFGTGAGLSGETLLNPFKPAVLVPDAGTTMGMLGLALSGIFAIRRKMN